MYLYPHYLKLTDIGINLYLTFQLVLPHKLNRLCSFAIETRVNYSPRFNSGSQTCSHALALNMFYGRLCAETCIRENLFYEDKSFWLIG